MVEAQGKEAAGRTFHRRRLSRADHARRTIEKGAQNLPDNREEHDFSLSTELARQLPLINGHEPLFVIDNHAVVQGRASGKQAEHGPLGNFTIGTGPATRASPTASEHARRLGGQSGPGSTIS